MADCFTDNLVIVYHYLIGMCNSLYTVTTEKNIGAMPRWYNLSGTGIRTILTERAVHYSALILSKRRPKASATSQTGLSF